MIAYRRTASFWNLEHTNLFAITQAKPWKNCADYLGDPKLTICRSSQSVKPLRLLKQPCTVLLNADPIVFCIREVPKVNVPLITCDGKSDSQPLSELWPLRQNKIVKSNEEQAQSLQWKTNYNIESSNHGFQMHVY